MYITRFSSFSVVLVLIVWVASTTAAQTIETAKLNSEVRDFFAKEVAVHFADIKSFNPLPESVNGSLTIGEFTWGSFMRVLAAQSEVSGSSKIAGKDTARAIAEMGLFEARSGAKAFSQLYAAQALRHFGTDLSKNAVWQSMNDAERKEWASLLDVRRIYDPKTRQVINLPANYFGVAARIAAYAFEFGVLQDRAFLDSLIERASEQFTSGALYSDDDIPRGRYDRYSNEYARFCFTAAGIIGRRDIQEKLKPTLTTQMKLWWDLVSDKGYGYNWGRSQGLVSYLDTLEIAAFLGEHSEFRPAPLADIAGLYSLAWRWIRGGYIDERHTFNIWSYGRGNYSYISLQREFQQISTSFAKIIVANDSFMKTLANEKVTQFPAEPHLSEVARFEYFNQSKEKKSGVWLVRQGNLHFALPITTGTKPAIADYLAAPFGLPGFAAPVEEVYPSLVPFFELEDGKTYAASEGSDLIAPTKDGQSLTVKWNHWAKIGTKSGERFENGITSEVTWKIEGNKLIRNETLITDHDLMLKHWRIAFPSTGDKTHTEFNGKARSDVFEGREGRQKVSAKADWKFDVSLLATGDSRIGKGVLGAIPLNLIYSADSIALKKGKKLTWEMTIEVLK